MRLKCARRFVDEVDREDACDDTWHPVCDKIDRIDAVWWAGVLRRTGRCGVVSDGLSRTSRDTGVEGSIDILTFSCHILDDSKESGVAAPCIVHSEPTARADGFAVNRLV